MSEEFVVDVIIMLLVNCGITCNEGIQYILA
jgi:hypothetical protein